MTLQPLPDFEPRQITRSLAVDWYDGALSGVFELSDPTEELAFESLAVRYSTDCIRIARARPLAPGTLDDVMTEAAPYLGPLADHRAVIRPAPDTLFSRLTFLRATATHVIAFVPRLGGPRLIAAWLCDMSFDEAAAEALLASIPEVR